MTDTELMQQAAEHALNADHAISPEDAAPFVTPHLAVIDGVVRVVHANGAMRTRPDSLGAGDRPMTVDELLTELRHTNPRFRYRHNDA